MIIQLIQFRQFALSKFLEANMTIETNELIEDVKLIVVANKAEKILVSIEVYADGVCDFLIVEILSGSLILSETLKFSSIDDLEIWTLYKLSSIAE